jgi:serine/threonine protein kinase
MPDRPGEPVRQEQPPEIAGIELDERIGSGATGVVYRGHQTYNDRPVAVKLLWRGLLGTEAGPRFAARFQREAKILSRLDHPNIVDCFQAGTVQGDRCFLVMELVDGPELDDWLTEHGAVGRRRALLVTLQLAQALQHAYGHGVIHRDIKPANVLLKPLDAPEDPEFPYQVKLADLGLARQETVDATITGADTCVGTPQTVAPEQALYPKTADFRADIYSLGCVLFHLLTGEPAFTGSSASEVIVRKATGDAPDPRQRTDSMDDDVADLVMRMLARDREHRPQTYAALISELEQLLDPSAPRTSAPRRPEATTHTPPPAAAAEAPAPPAPPHPPSSVRRLAAMLLLATAFMAAVFAAAWHLQPPRGESARAGAAAMPAVDLARERAAVDELAAMLRARTTPDGGFDNLLSERASAWGNGQALRALALLGEPHRELTTELIPTFEALEIRDTPAGDPPGAFSGYAYLTGTCTVAVLEPAAEVAMALALAKGRTTQDPAPFARRLLAYLLQAQNEDGSWSTIPIVGQASATTGATAMGLHGLVGLAAALPEEERALPAAARAGAWLCSVFTDRSGEDPPPGGELANPYAAEGRAYFEVNPRRRFGARRSIPGLDERAVLALVELRRLARDRGIALAPVVTETLATYARALRPTDLPPTFVGIPSAEDYRFANELRALGPDHHTGMGNCRFVPFGWRLLVAHAMATEPGLPRRGDWAREARRLRAEIPRLPELLRESEPWEIADILFGVACIAGTDPDDPAAFLLVDLVRR